MSGPVKDVLLHTGEFYFGGGRLRLRTLLGSCVAITVWHPGLLIGGMCHYMLPAPVILDPARMGPKGMYASGAIELFLAEMRARATVPADYVVKMFGGGNMFPDHAMSSQCAEPCQTTTRIACRNVPCKNVLTGRDLLGQHEFVVECEDIGGAGGRSILFEVWTGDVWVRRTGVATSGTQVP